MRIMIFSVLFSVLTLTLISCQPRENVRMYRDPTPDVNHLVMRPATIVTPEGNRVRFLFIGFRQSGDHTEAVFGWHVLLQTTRTIKIAIAPCEIRSGKRTIRSIDPEKRVMDATGINTAGSFYIHFPKMENPSVLGEFELIEQAPAGTSGIRFSGCRVLEVKSDA